MRPYQDIRVIDLTHELGSYAARLFGDLGAEVIRVEKSATNADRSREPVTAGLGVSFEYFNVNKKSVVLDYTTTEGRAVLADLIGSAGLVFYEPAEGDGELLRLIRGVPGRRVVTVLSYFGTDGPYSDFRGSDLVAQAVGGIAWLTGNPDAPPLRLAGEQSFFVTSLYAAAATSIALWDSERSGKSHVLDVSAQECIAHSLQNAPQVYDLERAIARRGGEGTRDATENIFACKDGYVFVAAPLQLAKTWDALVEWMCAEGGAAFEVLREPEWSDRIARRTSDLHARFRQLFEAFAANRTKRELLETALARKVILAPVASVGETLSDPQLQYRNFFQTVPHPLLGRDITFPGAPYATSESIWAIETTAPVAGANQSQLDEAGQKTAGVRRAG